MARIKDIESLRSRSASNTYKDKPDPPSITTAFFHHRKAILSILLATITILFLIYRYQSPDSTLSFLNPYPNHHQGDFIDWTRFAYSQYATDQHYLCNSLMLFSSLQSLHSKADRLLFYPKSWDLDISDGSDRTSQLLVLARDNYHVKLKPVEMYTLKHSNTDSTVKGTWDASINKLYAFAEGQYDRIIHLDSDITLLKNIDELFFVPRSTVAMPRAYWKDTQTDQTLTSLIIVLEPSAHEASALWDAAAGLSDDNAGKNLYDMDLLNARYGQNALVLPHRRYALVTGEFRRPGRRNHTMYLGNDWEEWNAAKVLEEAKVLHFSDWPLPKPWIMWPNSLMRDMQPECEFDNGTPYERECEDRKVWKGLYDDFRRRRKDVCKLLSVPAPDWPPKERGVPNAGSGIS